MQTSERFNHPSRFLIVGVAALGLTIVCRDPAAELNKEKRRTMP
jgi:hypothetical protein